MYKIDERLKILIIMTYVILFMNEVAYIGYFIFIYHSINVG